MVESQIQESVRVLIKAGAKPDLALIEAVDYLSPATLTLFLDGGANPNVEVEPHQAIIFRALRAGRPQNAELLVEKGANPNVADETGYSPTMRAALSNYWSSVRYFLEVGKANDAYVAPDGQSLLSIVQNLQQKALETDAGIARSPDFLAVCAWLEKQGANTHMEK